MGIRIFAINKKGIYKGGKEEISNNLYWFEENGVENFDDERYDFEIIVHDLRVYPIKMQTVSVSSSESEYQEKLAQAKEIYKMPVKDNMPYQKFPRGARVHVGEMPPYRSHFDSNFDGIVEYTYAQKLWGSNIKDYCLIILKDGKPVNSCAWYQEDQMTLVNDDIQAGLKIIEEYENRKNYTLQNDL